MFFQVYGRLDEHDKRCLEILAKYPDAWVQFYTPDDASHLYASREDGDEYAKDYERQRLMERLKDAEDRAASIKAELEKL